MPILACFDAFFDVLINITLDLITYPAGKVYRLPVQITYTAANTQNVSHTLNFYQNVKVRYQLDELRMENYNISGIELTEGRLPDGLMLANSSLNKFGLYGTPTESGEFTAKYRVTAFNHIYNYTINVTVDKSFTVSFDPNGGSGSMEDVVVPENSAYTLPECKFTAPDGKVFKGWDYGAPGEKLTESMDRDYTVKALWEDSLIRDVRISGLKIPVAGELGCTVADLSVPAGVHYQIEKIEWISMDSEVDGTVLNPSHPFETGHTYYAFIKVKADDGYEFWCDGSGKADLDVITLNGEAALVQHVSAYEPERLTVLSQDYALAATENIIRNVQVTGLILPVAGEGAVSADQLSVPAGAHYKVIGLKWYDAATGTEVELPFQFENGKSYFARMDIRAELGYAFPFVGTMNPGFDSFTVNGDTSLQNNLIMLGNRIARLETVVFDAAPAATTYAFTKGAGGTWTKGTEGSLKFTVKGSPDDTDTFMKFGGIEVDGTEVPTDGYTASAGSVNISLKASWLNSLSEGAHQLKVSLKDGSAETSFTVAAGKKQPDVPKTGDNANLLLWLGMVLLGLLGICGLSAVRNRK